MKQAFKKIGSPRLFHQIWFEDSQVAYEQVLKEDNSYNILLIFIKVFSKFLDNLFSSNYSYFSITFCT
jgi:hypothetical protein